jgi:hypothetical protein
VDDDIGISSRDLSDIYIFWSILMGYICLAPPCTGVFLPGYIFRTSANTFCGDADREASDRSQVSGKAEAIRKQKGGFLCQNCALHRRFLPGATVSRQGDEGHGKKSPQDSARAE